MKRRIAVIGAGGFVGSRMIEMAALRGFDDIVPVVRSLSGAARLARFGVDCRIGDANTENGIASAIGDCDAVVNLTAGDSRRLVGQLKNIHAACARNSVKTLVHLSSAVVFGEAADSADLGGAAPPTAHSNLYTREKARAEQFLAAQSTSTMAVVTLRPGLVWGPRSPWVAGPLTALSNGTAFLVAGGSGICNLIYVDNLIHSVLAAARQTLATSGFYNVSDDRRVTWREYYAALGSMAGLDVDAVVDIGDAPFRSGVTSYLQGMKETWGFDVLKRRLSSRTKLKMKQMLRDGISKFAADSNGPASVRVTREMWMLQRTRGSLSTEAFAARFGLCNAVEFERALQNTAAWAAYAGFTPQRRAPAVSAPAFSEVATHSPVCLYQTNLRLTIVTHELPYPANHGGKVDMWSRLSGLSSLGVALQLIVWGSNGDSSRSIDTVRKVVDDVVILRRRVGRALLWRGGYPPRMLTFQPDRADWRRIEAEVRAFAPGLPGA